MRAYIIRRLLLVIPVMVIVSLISFFLMHIAPGDYVDALVAAEMEQSGLRMVEFDVEQLRRELGLDKPVYIQYGAWLGVLPQPDGSYNGVFQGSLGESWAFNQDVLELMVPTWPITFQLGIMGLIIGWLISLPIGIYSALRQDKWGDYVGRSFAIFLISVPSFWLATLIITYPSLWWGHSPPLMLIHFTEDPIGNLGMFIVPAILVGIAMSGGMMRLSRTMMLEVLRQDYIRTAWAKGLRERVVTLRHALKNALIPVVTVMGSQMMLLIGGTVIIEQIFNLPGMGRLTIDATLARDYPLMSGLLLILGTTLVLLNLTVDISYGYLDPRIRYK